MDIHSWAKFPVQKLSLREKDEEWKKANVDALVGRESGFSKRHTDMKVSYDLYNSIFDENDLKYVVNPYKVEDGFPASIQNINIIRPKIELLKGEETKRPSNFLVYQTDEAAVDQVEDKQKELLYGLIESSLMSEVNLSTEESTNQIKEQLAEIQEYIGSKYYNPSEQIARKTLKYLNEHLSLKDEFLKGWEDALIAGEEIYYTGIINGEPLCERVNPLTFSYDRDPDLKNIEDGEWAVRSMRMTPSAIYDRFYDLMDEKDLDRLLQEISNINGASYPQHTGSTINTNYITYRDLTSTFTGDEEEQTRGVFLPVWHVTWKSFKKVGFLVTEDENGDMVSTIVDETYKRSEGENIEWDWIIEVWEGYKLGNSMYLGMAPVEYQPISIDNPNARKLPYVGMVYNNNNTTGKSLVEIMKPLQYMYLIIFYRLELTLARDKGRVFVMDPTQIPKSMGIDPSKWLHYLSAMGVAFVNPYEEGWDIPGREGGRPASFNQFTAVDLSMTNAIREYVELLNKIEEMIGELSGVSKARQGQIHQDSLVGNVKQEITQSSHITEPLFWKHNQIKRNVYTSLLNVAKYAWRVSNLKKINFVLEGPERLFLEITDEFLYSDHDVFVTDSTQEIRNVETLRQLYQPAMQGGATLLDIATLMTTDSVSEIKRKLESIEKKRQKSVEAEQKMEQQKIQMELQMQADANRITEDDSIRRADTSIQVALINADNKQAVAEGKNSVQQQKERTALNYETRKQSEVERHNKAQEEITKNKPKPSSK